MFTGGVVNSLLRNQIVKGIKKQLGVPNFKHLEIELKDGRIRYCVDFTDWKSREMDDDDKNEGFTQLGFNLTEVRLTITANEIIGYYVDENRTKIDINI